MNHPDVTGPAPVLASGADPILLTGASGYIGGRLLQRLAPMGHELRCLTRSPDVLASRLPAGTRLVAGDVLDADSLRRALRGIRTAYYLVHSMGGSAEFEDLDRRGAINFAQAARAAGVEQIVYLGGLGAGGGLSAHLASRHEVGRLLHASGVPTLELRASIVIGSGSASFEIVRALVERLPVIVAPRWVETLAQPIAVDDVLEYLLAPLQRDQPVSAVYEIGGADQVTYADVMREYARRRGLRRSVIRAPLITPSTSRLLLGLLTPVYGRVAAAMVDSLRHETTVHDSAALRDFAVRPRGLRAAIERALLNEDREFAATRWSDALPQQAPLRWGGVPVGRRLISSRAQCVATQTREAFAPIQHIGGSTGWYANDRFWHARGLLDTLRGGVGLRRGRRDPRDLRIGDTIDFWRVDLVVPERLLLLAAEMKLPGRLWLQFEVRGVPGCTEVRQTTVFDPAGYAGLTYWYLLYPIHHRVFGAMLKGVCMAGAEGESPGRTPLTKTAIGTVFVRPVPRCPSV